MVDLPSTTEYSSYEILNGPDLFLYWIGERYEILSRRKSGMEKPWSTDPVFQRVYFCNVRREDDKVTRWIRDRYSDHCHHPLFEYNIVLARFLNRPSTLEDIGFQTEHQPRILNDHLREIASSGKRVWGNAYVITTHGMPMQKMDYLTNCVLEDVFERVEAIKKACRGGSGGGVLQVLEEIDGIGSFLGGQIVADLKNTIGHPLYHMDDWWTFVVPGPGSLRGASWFHFSRAEGVTAATFRMHFDQIRHWIDEQWAQHLSFVPRICNQDLQNCLCEFDKYMRVKTNSGRSKRSYPGV